MTYLRKRKQQNLNTAFTANTASQQVSTTVLDVTNSEVTFTPPSGNFTHVVYEYTLQYDFSPSSSTNVFLELREKIGNGAYTQLGDGYRVNEVAQTQKYQSTLTGRFLIPIYSGARSYKLTIRAKLTTRQITLHQTTSGDVYSPIIQVYCV
tara:strand:+ start:1362 stop:1814 length:453 start_codon:yes stop_codon:yes gene_type:complete